MGVIDIYIYIFNSRSLLLNKTDQWYNTEEHLPLGGILAGQVGQGNFWVLGML